MTREHAHPNWVLDVLPDHPRAGTTMAQSSAAPFRYWYTKGETGIKVRSVCEKCNTGWMSRLEGQARRILEPFILGSDRHTITRDEQLFIEFWTLKTAMVFDSITDRGLRYFSVEERLHVATTHKLPRVKNYYVFIAKNIGSQELWADHYSFEIAKDEVGSEAVGRFYCADFVYGQLVIQFASCRTQLPPAQVWPRLDPNNIDVHIDITGGRREQPWPPKVLLDDEGLVKFKNRWIRPPNQTPLKIPKSSS
jgi:hypothetical protein